MQAHTCNPSTAELGQKKHSESEASPTYQVPDQPGLHEMLSKTSKQRLSKEMPLENGTRMKGSHHRNDLVSQDQQMQRLEGKTQSFLGVAWRLACLWPIKHRQQCLVNLAGPDHRGPSQQEFGRIEEGMERNTWSVYILKNRSCDTVQRLMCWGRDCCCRQANSDTEKSGREPYLRWQAREGAKVRWSRRIMWLSLETADRSMD